jgi:hypothetical protein
MNKWIYNGYEVAVFVYDGDRERRKELWVELNGEFIGAIRFIYSQPSREQVEAYIDEYFSEISVGLI